MYLGIYIYNFFGKKKHSGCATKNRHALVTMRLFLSRTGGGAPENFQRTALLEFLQGQQRGSIIDNTVDYVLVSGGWCAGQTIHPGEYSLVSASPSRNRSIVNGVGCYTTTPLNLE